GFCGTCRCLLKKGTVEYAQFPLAFIGDNEILTCCSTPTSDIEIDIHG
ncbi:MAG: ferredoxin, partial [Cognaticolwellia sp.]